MIETSLQLWIDNLLGRARAARFRVPILLQGNDLWCQQWHDALRAAFTVDGWLSIDCDHFSSNQARRLLGREFASVALSGNAPPSPDLLAISAGTVQAGGVLLLDFPEGAAWDSCFDRQLWQSFHSCREVLRLTQGEPLPLLPEWQPQEPPREDGMGCLNPEQQYAVAAALQVVHGHRRRPLVITAERGRGKSAALGICAARLLSEGRQRVLVTAAKRQAVDTLFARVTALLPDGIASQEGWQWQQGEVRFIPPDQLLQQRPEADLLLVDEAAAIPAPLLSAMLAHYPRIVFATTTQGYEGTGRGFTLRFHHTLDQLTPGWRGCSLSQPIRWGEGDPLERWLYRTLLLDAAPADFAELAQSSNPPAPVQRPACVRSAGDALSPDFHFGCWSGAELLGQPQLLQQLFALLVQAHYQTTPNDLRDLLQGEGRQVWLLLYQGQVAGGVLTVAEGGLDANLCTDIWLGQRRPPGHLLPQSLIAHSGWLEAGGLRYQRVIRIAVHPQLQRRGLGLWMLQQLRQSLQQRMQSPERLELLGSSFAASDHLPDFWYQAGYRPMRLGLQRDAASGCHSLLVLQPLTDEAEDLCREVQTRFATQLLAQLRGAYAELEAALVVQLLQQLGRSGSCQPESLDTQDAADLVAYVLGGRGFDQVEPVLRRFVLQQLLDPAGETAAGWSADDAELLIQRILQYRPVAACCQSSGLSGRRELEQRLRMLLRIPVATQLLPALSVPLRQRLGPLLQD